MLIKTVNIFNKTKKMEKIIQIFVYEIDRYKII